MDGNKTLGLISIIIGLIFIVFPIFSSDLISVIVGLSLLFFGISAVFFGWNMRNTYNYMLSNTALIIGIIAVIFGFLFLFYIDALPFLVSIQFYIVGFIMIIFGITGFLSRVNNISNFTSILVFLMGIVAIALAIFAQSQPIFITMVLGAVLIFEGLGLYVSD
jgi:uncharacterized membrane protein HdeD (DUF308 family)